MHVNSVTPQPHKISQTAAQQPNEVAAKREPIGNVNDMSKKAARAIPAQQTNPQGAGTKINLLA